MFTRRQWYPINSFADLAPFSPANNWSTLVGTIGNIGTVGSLGSVATDVGSVGTQLPNI